VSIAEQVLGHEASFRIVEFVAGMEMSSSEAIPIYSGCFNVV